MTPPSKTPEYRRRYYQENKERMLGRSKAWYEKNKSKPEVKERIRQYNKRKGQAINERRRQERMAYVRQWKAERGCARCGESHPACLDLHHVDPDTKDPNYKSLYMYSYERIDQELSKCVVLCANCHRKEHASDE